MTGSHTTRGNPGVHGIAVGEMVVTALNDGQFEASTGLVVGPPADHVETMLRATRRVLPPRITVSCFLVEAAGKRILIDGGAGGAFGQVLGHAGDGLAALGISPGDIDEILLTHGHIDHVGGLVSGAEARFPAARLHASEAELAFWGGPGRELNNSEAAVGAIAAYALRTVPFGDGAEILPGITAHALPGHTPGHTGFMIRSGGQALFMWADVVHLPGVQFAMPSAGVAFDVDVDLARQSRARALDMAASDDLLVAGIHLDFPTFGHVLRHADAYAFEPVVWSPTPAGPFS